MVVAWGDSQGLKTVSRAPAALKQVQGDKKRAVILGSTRNRRIEVDEHCHCNPGLESRVGIATRFPPASKLPCFNIVGQVCPTDICFLINLSVTGNCRVETDFPATATLKQVQGDKNHSVIPGSTRNRKDKLINIALAALKQIQVAKIPLSFRTCFGIARMKLINIAPATLKQV